MISTWRGKLLCRQMWKYRIWIQLLSFSMQICFRKFNIGFKRCRSTSKSTLGKISQMLKYQCWTRGTEAILPLATCHKINRPKDQRLYLCLLVVVYLFVFFNLWLSLEFSEHPEEWWNYWFVTDPHQMREVLPEVNSRFFQMIMWNLVEKLRVQH